MLRRVARPCAGELQQSRAPRLRSRTRERASSTTGPSRARRLASGPAVARTQLVGDPVEPVLVQHRALAPDLVLADLDDPVQPDVRRAPLRRPTCRRRCRPSSGRRRARPGSTASARRGRGPRARRRAPAGPCRGRRPPRRAPRSRRSHPGRRRRRDRARRRSRRARSPAGAVRAPPLDGRGRASVRDVPGRDGAGRWALPLPLLRRLRQQLEPGLRRLPQQAPPRRHGATACLTRLRAGCPTPRVPQRARGAPDGARRRGSGATSAGVPDRDDVDQRPDADEVVRVHGQQRQAGGRCGRGDLQIEPAWAGLRPAIRTSSASTP